MTVFGWVWLVGGFFVGLACAVAWERATDGEEGWTSGLAFILAWFLAPFVVGCGTLVALIWASHVLVARVERRVPDRRSRGELERRIAELERDLQVGGPAG